MRDFTLFAIVLATVACAYRVETFSPPARVSLHFTNTCNGELKRHAGAGRLEPIALVDGKAIVDVPAMGGGYTESGGKVSDVHDPATYPVVRLVDGSRTLIELSLEQIRALPRDAEGFSLVDVRC